MNTHTQNKIQILLILTFVCSFIFPAISFAQSVSIESDKTTHNVGDTFLVTVVLNSLGKSINSLGGIILVPQGYFEVQEMQTGESFVSLWAQRPTFNSNTGEIIFGGGLPGGYSGSNGTIFTFVLKVTKEGASEIGIKDFNAFLNDGKGTSVPVKISALRSSSINDPSVPNETYTSKEDAISPESFELSIDQDPSIEEGKYFVSFFAVDKGSGIQKYEVEERPWLISILGYKKVWQNAQNPQVLAYQKWGSTVKVRAFDMDGNFTEEKITKPMANEYKIILWILLILVLIFCIKKNKKRV